MPRMAITEKRLSMHQGTGGTAEGSAKQALIRAVRTQLDVQAGPACVFTFEYVRPNLLTNRQEQWDATDARLGEF